ncbi:MAG: dihydroorotate dehydrogenase electron transfer subunit [Bacteroides sp.]|nr:dihydroorotate dehydrogenase electron transfer subunit [Bacteroides sp.]
MAPKKYIMDFEVVKNDRLHDLYTLLILKPVEKDLPEINPGQFVQVAVDNSKTTFLRRPISVNFVDRAKNHLWLLVRKAGDGTAALMEKKQGDVINLILPLGNSFTMPQPGTRVLLAGGGVGVAPMLYWGSKLKEAGIAVEFLLGARSAKDVLELPEFEAVGKVHVSTEDGSMGEQGLVTGNSALSSEKWDIIYCCGPAPMMKAVAKVAASIGADCEVSLENMMACGLGACLCCVEKTVKGNVCVCTEGPIFNINQLTWQI